MGSAPAVGSPASSNLAAAAIEVVNTAIRTTEIIESGALLQREPEALADAVLVVINKRLSNVHAVQPFCRVEARWLLANSS